MYQSEIEHTIWKHDQNRQILAEQMAFGQDSICVFQSKNGMNFNQDYLGNSIKPNITYVKLADTLEVVAFDDLLDYLKNNGFSIQDNSDQDYIIGFLDGYFGNNYEIREAVYIENI